jgi:hypothetical protein
VKPARSAREQRELGAASESLRVADTPQFLTLKKNRDRTERLELFLRRAFFTVVFLIILAGLLNLFGQRPKNTFAASSAADLHVFAPTALRGGLYYEGRITIDAKQDIKKATVVLDSGWTEQMQINTIEPSPVGESSRDGKLALELGHIPAGQKHVLWMQFQVNPTNVGRRSQDVALYDDTTLLAQVDRTVTIFP